MFHCLVIKVVSLSALCDSLFRLSHLEELVKNFFQKFFEVFSKGFRRRHFSYLFKRLDYFTISSVDCQQLIWIFWKLFYFSVFQKQFLATACLLYHCRKEKSSTFYKKLQIFLCRLFVELCQTIFLASFPCLYYTIRKYFISVSLFNIISGIFGALPLQKSHAFPI